MSLTVEPNTTLRFLRTLPNAGPFTESTRAVVKVTNSNPFQVAFKFKTTAPRHYSVRPNSGVVPANDSTEVVVVLQHRDEIPDGKCKDKFLVQSIQHLPNKDMNDFWPYVEQNKPLEIIACKLNCEFCEETPPEPVVEKVSPTETKAPIQKKEVQFSKETPAKIIVDPGHYPPKTVAIIAIIAFFLGVVLF